MKKLPKRPRTFGRTKAKPYKQQKQQPQRRMIRDEDIISFGEIFPGFFEWYRQNYDRNGKYIGERILYGSQN